MLSVNIFLAICSLVRWEDEVSVGSKLRGFDLLGSKTAVFWPFGHCCPVVPLRGPWEGNCSLFIRRGKTGLLKSNLEHIYSHSYSSNLGLTYAFAPEISLDFVSLCLSRPGSVNVDSRVQEAVHIHIQCLCYYNTVRAFFCSEKQALESWPAAQFCAPFQMLSTFW